MTGCAGVAPWPWGTHTIEGVPVTPAIVLAIDLNGPGRYLHVGPIQIGLGNLLVIALMVVVFVVALLVPFPRDKR